MLVFQNDPPQVALLDWDESGAGWWGFVVFCDAADNHPANGLVNGGQTVMEAIGMNAACALRSTGANILRPDLAVVHIVAPLCQVQTSSVKNVNDLISGGSDVELETF